MEFKNIAIILLIFLLLKDIKEKFKGGSNGALIQLIAKGAQDWYLTGDPGYYYYYH